jgi:hypothetical protein
MKHTIVIIAAVVSILVATSAFAGEKCKCRFNGGYIDEGKTACLKTPKGLSLARCVKVLNNTSWKSLDLPCPVASLSPNAKEFQTPFPPLKSPKTASSSKS